jgi:ATP-binding protein involved in chromosome partitioning
MASNALTQLIEQTQWGTLDYLIVDMPPGTGDISITLAQKFKGARAIIVVTPQQLAIADGRKAARMFSAKGIDVNLLGLVENMAYFTPENHPDEKYLLFSQGGGEQLSKELNVPLMAQIPLVAGVCELADSGKPVFVSDHEIIIEQFTKLAHQIHKEMNTVTSV